MIDFEDEHYQQARAALAEGELDTVRAILKGMLETDPDSVAAAELCGDLAQAQGDLEKAERFYRKMTRLSDDPITRGTAHLSLGVLAAIRHDYAAGEALLGDAAETFEQLGMLEQAALATLNLGEVQLNACHLRPAQTSFEKAIAAYEELSELESLAESYFQLATAHRMLGELDEAEAVFHRASALYEAADDICEVANCLDGLGVIHQIRGAYEEAERFHREAAEINERAEYWEGLAVNFGNLATLCHHRKQHAEAIDWLEKSRALEVTHDLDVSEAEYLSSLGNLREELGELDEAEQLQLRAIRLAKQQGDQDTLVFAWQRLAVVYRRIEPAGGGRLRRNGPARRLRRRAQRAGHAAPLSRSRGRGARALAAV
jgi:tetratricopeptide (TPR) repeat protein